MWCIDLHVWDLFVIGGHKSLLGVSLDSPTRLPHHFRKGLFCFVCVCEVPPCVSHYHVSAVHERLAPRSLLLLTSFCMSDAAFVKS